MASRNVPRARKEIDEELIAAALLARVQEIVSAAAAGREHVGSGAQGHLRAVDALPRKAELQQIALAALTPRLAVLHRRQPLPVGERAGGGNGIQRAEAQMRLMVEIAQEIAVKNIAARCVGLRMQKIAGGP